MAGLSGGLGGTPGTERRLLGVFFHQLSRRIERTVDRVFSRHDYESRAILRDFARDAAYIENPSVLLERAADLLALHAGGGSAAIYEAT